MSYTIEHGKRVLELKTTDKRFSNRESDLLVFVAASSCNNVSPRHYDWNVIAASDYSAWNGNLILPTVIWQLGSAADGGGIKPWNKEVSGLTYVKGWKTAVKQRTPIDGWTPNVSIWIGEGYREENVTHSEAINTQGAALFGGPNDYCKRTYGPRLYEAFKRLFPNPLPVRRAGSETAYVSNHDQLLDAVYLYMHRDQLPFSFYLTDSEHAAFFKKEPVVEGDAHGTSPAWSPLVLGDA